MAGIKQYDVDPPASDPNGIAEDQQPDTGTPVVLNGAMCDLGTALQFDIGDAFSDGIGGVALLFESASSWAAVTFTIVGKDSDGADQTVTHTGPTTNNTTTTYWSQVTAITCDGTVATDIEIGAADVFVTPTVILNHYSDQTVMTAVTGLAGTIQFDVEESFSEVAQAGTANASWWTKVSNSSADESNALSDNATATRMKVDSFTDTAELQFHVIYNPYR
jgi:hypothetical protein